MLTPEEYQEIKHNESALTSQIESYKADMEGYRKAAMTTTALMKNAEARLRLYINYLADAVKEYEDAHPPEPINR